MADTDFIVINVDDAHVKIDPEFKYLFDRFTWRHSLRTRKSYITSSTSENGKRVHMYLHRIVIGAVAGEICDHINGDTSDNRRCNLRLVTVAQNNWNAAKKRAKHGNRFRGIAKRSYGFQSFITVGGKLSYLGTFKTDVEAAYAYDVASIEQHGEFGRRNFLPLV